MSSVSLDDVKDHLNVTEDKDDVELGAMLAAAEAILANSVGPLDIDDPVTTRVVGADSLVVPVAPLMSVSVVTTTDAVTIDSTSYTADLAAGVVRFTDGRSTPATYLVTYTAGRETLPADLELAVKEMVRHLWNSQRGPARRPGSIESTEPQAGYLLPYLVEQLIEPYRLIGVGAA